LLLFLFLVALSIPGFGSFSNRQTYLIDPKGNLRWIFSDVESHIPRHSEEVLSKLKDLEAKGVASA
jgi:peroxiredoxin Q/BCP